MPGAVPYVHGARGLVRLHHRLRDGRFDGPEGMLGRGEEPGEDLRGPPRGPGGEVLLHDRVVRVAVAHGESPFGVEDGPLPPPAEVAAGVPGGLGPRDGLDVGGGQRAPQAALGEAVAEAAAVGDGRAVGGEPGPELAGERGGVGHVPVVAAELEVQERVGVEREGVVVVDAAARAVLEDGVAELELPHAFEVRGRDGGVVLDADALEAVPGEDREVMPVGVGDARAVGGGDPGGDLVFGLAVQGVPDLLGGEGEGPADGGGFDDALAARAAVADVPGVVGVEGAREGGGEGGPDVVGDGVLGGGEAPQGPGQQLEPVFGVGVVRHGDGHGLGSLRGQVGGGLAERERGRGPPGVAVVERSERSKR